jgi:hypothetical protein
LDLIPLEGALMHLLSCYRISNVIGETSVVAE